jgi:transcriptional regulator with XRE-family HTH domain
MSERRFLKLIGKRIAELRKEQGLTQIQLADLCEMERSAIARLESGTENITASTFYKLSKALNVTMKEFFNFEY